MSVEFSSVRVLARQFGTVPIELRRELRPKLRQAGEGVASKVRSNASWSTRIPGAVRLSVAFGSKTGGVRVYVDKNRAEHARPLEGLSGSPFRHPLWGNREAWVSQPARPFFFPAVKQSREQVRDLVADAVRASFPKGV